MESRGNVINGKKKDLKLTIESKRAIEKRLQAVLPSSLTEEIDTEDVYIGLLKNRRDTSKAIKMISLAVPGFGYLKRCYGNRLILGRVKIFENHKSKNFEENLHNNSEEEFKIFLKSQGFDLSLIDNELEIKKLPKKSPITKKQSNQCSKIWPVNFHPDKTIESIISGDIFTDEQLNSIEILMGLVIEAARLSSIGNIECNGGALIIDPTIGVPIALASSKIDENPLWHAAMLAIDLVAKYQGGGAWNYDKYSCDDRATSERLNKRKNINDGMPLCYPKELIDINIPEIEPLINFKISKTVETITESSSSNNKNQSPYLCTNFWVFLTQEPCSLCSMALVHSRASKIFYGIDKEFGFLKTKAMLHTIPGLNHRYQVWSGVNQSECKLLSNEIKIREIH